MADTVEVALVIAKLVRSSDVPVPVSLMNHTVEEAASIIGAVIEICDRDGISLRQICMDPELSEALGLSEGMEFPHGGRPLVRLQEGLGRQLLFER